ncbi:hypothetical protein ABWK22_02845 [Gottfriedia acidiceleris]|uniref:hypothetical protein n=1 Tax=Gottfriedia acidiceleris TaxID=371036 RepID=UPI003394654F
MSKVKVIIQPSFGIFEPKEDFKKLIDKTGRALWNLSGRTNEDYIKFVEDNADDGILFGKESWTYIKVVEVDTSRPWLIDDYDGSESIKYVKYRVIDKELNYVELKD